MTDIYHTSLSNNTGGGGCGRDRLETARIQATVKSALSLSGFPHASRHPALALCHPRHAAGRGELGKEVIIALQRLGVEVIAVDRYANAPGHQVAHRAHVIDMSDGAALRALIEQEQPHLVVPEIEAIATETLLEIEAAGLAEVIPTARAAHLTMNREGIRRLAAETLGLPTSPYVFADSLAEMSGRGRKAGLSR